MREQVSKFLASPNGPVLTEAEQKQLAAWNDTPRAHPQDACVPQLVAAQAAATPDAVALVAGCEAVTYRELDSRANRLAHHLRSLGAGQETLVALCLERSLALVAGALGVLKSGGAYVPLDPTYPPERLAFMLNDSQAPIVVTQQRPAGRLPTGRWRVVDLDVDAEQIARYAADPPQADLKVENLAYVIYTSGSTGRPKGVQITHDSLLNLVFWHRRTFAVRPADRATLQASPGFDASVWELWPYITAGASVHLPDEAIRNDPESLRDWLVAQRITVSFIPTPLAERLMALEWPPETALRILLTGADVLHYYPSPGLPFTLVNNYGPTECTVVATSGPVPSDERPDVLPTIGRPIANTQIYILDEQLQQVPVGVAGEIYIGGAGLARGYLNCSELTARRFIPNPFGSEPNARLYSTGDLARYLPNGEIAFLGRIDEQIKIRGYRIEPNEIVTVLNRNAAIQASQVVAREDTSGNKHLVAYVVPVPGSRPTYEALRDFLREMLPEYMVPAVFVLLESLPLTFNGKVDRDALPAPNAANTLRDGVFTAPRSVVEERLTNILTSLLGLEQVGADDNFFLLGGHSLLGMHVIAQVQDAFGVELTLRSLFQAPTTAQLTAEVERLLLARREGMSEDDARHLLGTSATQPNTGGSL